MKIFRNNLSLNKKIALLKYLALLLLSLGLLVLYIKRFYSFIFLALFSIAGIFLSILLPNSSLFDRGAQDRFINYKIYNILFLIITSFAGISLLIGENEKSALFYISISFCACLLGLEIAYTSNYSSFLLAKIYLLCLIIFISNQFVFPFGIGGADSFKHLETIQSILITGYIMPEYVYSFIPLHHLLISISAEISSFDYRKLYYILGPLAMSFNCLILYSIGKSFISERVGLLCALIYPYNDYILFWGSHAAQLTYLIPLLCLLFWIFHLKLKKNSVGFSIIALILITAIIFAHHYSSFILVFLLFAFIISYLLVQNEYTLGNNIYLGLFLFLIVALFTHWVFYSNLIDTFSGIVEKYLSTLIGIMNIDSSYVASSSHYDNLSLNLIFLNTAGSGILLMLSFYKFPEILIKINNFYCVIIIWMAITMSFICLGIFFSFKWLLPNRIYVFLQIFCLIFLASITLERIYIRESKISCISYLLLIFCIAFFSSASTIAGFETSLFNGNQTYIKLYELPEELYAEDWVERYIPSYFIMYPSGSIYPPSLYSTWAKNSSHCSNEIPIFLENNTINLSSMQKACFILFSIYDIEIGVPYYKGTGCWGTGMPIKLSKNTIDQLDGRESFNLIYDNDAIMTYYMMDIETQ